MLFSGYESPRILSDIGLIYLKQKENEEALKYFKKAAEINEDYYIDVAEFYEIQRDYPNAIKHYNIVLENWENSNMQLAWFKEIQNLKKKISDLEKLNR